MVLAFASAALAFAGPAAAQEAADTPEVDPAASALDAYNRARTAYEAGDFEGALALLTQAAREDEKPVYVYNMARVLEAMGRNAEAHASFLRTRALPGVTPELDQLAQASVERLEPLRAKAVVAFDAPDGTLVQLGEQVVVDLTKKQVRDPGPLQICVTPADGRTMSCWTRTLQAGVGTTWPPKAAGATRGEIVLPEGEPLETVELDGFRLVADLARLRSILVDVGTHVVRSKASGGLVYEHRIDVLPGKAAAIPRTGGELVAGQVVDEPIGPMPWIIGGSGLALAITGGVLIGVAPGLRKNSTRPTELGLGFRISDGFLQTQHQEAWTRSYRMQAAGYALVGVGGAALVGGLAWLLAGAYGGDSEGGDAAWGDFHVVPSGNGLVVGGGF